MSRAAEILRLCVRIHARARRNTALLGRNTGGRRFMVDRYGKRRLMVIRVIHHHLWELQLPADFCAHRHTD